MEEFYNIEGQESVARLLSSKNGLNDEESKKRLIEYGYNVLEDRHKVNPLKIFLEQFKGFLIYILFAAVIISFILNEYIDAIAILIILILNGVLGFLQEYRAEKSIDALKKLSTTSVTVIRNGKKTMIDSKFVVPGDIIFINSGDKISCDARVLEVFLFQVDESSLTGESVAVKKKTEAIIGEKGLADRKNMVYSGTLCVSGNAIALCTSTGMDTELGKIADNITEQQEMLTPLQKDLDKLGKFIGYFVILVCIIILFVGLFDDPVAISAFTSGNYLLFLAELKDLFLTSVALAVAAVPEGMAIVVTIALAIGVKVMVKKHALIRKLPAIETLGCTTVICSDKTGTLTYNQMTVKRIFANLDDIQVTGDGYKADGEFFKEGKQVSHSKIELLLECGCLNNNAELQDEHVVGDPTEGSLIVSYEKLGLHKHQLDLDYKRIREIPFDSERKMMSTLNSNKSDLIMFSKGAPESILKLCDKIYVNGKSRNMTPSDRKKILEQNSAYAKDALRVLGFAYKPLKNEQQFKEEKLIFLGLQGMIDPPRKEVRDSILKCHNAGIKVMMITGDHALTAEAIGKEIGIEGKTISGADIDKIDLEKDIYEYAIFARVSPEHKMKIVEILQNKGEVVAMTGDGVNDAPALKHADIGIAMGITGTDVSKEASKMILLDDNFTSIVNAVEEGRGIYGNIKKFVNYMFSSNFAEVMIIFVALLIGFKSEGNIILPFTALQILWLNLVTDSLPALALAVDPTSSKVMEKKPRKKDAKILDRQMLANIIYVGVIVSIAVLGLFKWGLDTYDVLTAQTMALTLLVLLEIARVQVIRAQHHLSIFSNRWLLLALGSTILLQLAMIYLVPIFAMFNIVVTNPLKLIPLDMNIWLIMIAITAIVYFVSVGFSKTLDKMIPD